MKASLRALLTGVIDYAGLFPPAELSLDEAVRKFARYRREPESWMLGRFICPAARLHELEPYARELFDLAEPLRVSALGRGGKSPEEFITGFGRDVEGVVEFEDRAGRRVNVGVLETRLPPSPSVAFDFDSERLNLYLEPAAAPDWRGAIASAVAVARGTGHRCGFKLRTGGVEAAAFPPGEQIAFAIATCRDESVPIKFTAGLHHPVRHFNDSVNAKMHGFVNVFVAGALAHAARLSEHQLVEILDDEDPGNFRFDDGALGWRDLRATTDQVTSIRRERVISFGSCSFDEPRDDLRALGWL